MNKLIATQRAFLKQENSKFGPAMQYVPEPWPPQQGVSMVGVWRSKDYLAQLVIEEKTKAVRLSVQRTMIDEKGGWVEGIAWEELQRVKSECGMGHLLAVEVYPRDRDVVNVANMRHLFLMPIDFEIGWKSKREAA